MESSQLESDLEKTENAPESAESGVTNLVVDNNVWQNNNTYYNFDDDMFVGGKNKKKDQDLKRGKLTIVMQEPRVP